MAAKRTWTDEELEESVRASCERSGVPVLITDPAVLSMIARLVVDALDNRNRL